MLSLDASHTNMLRLYFPCLDIDINLLNLNMFPPVFSHVLNNNVSKNVCWAEKSEIKKIALQ